MFERGRIGPMNIDARLAVLGRLCEIYDDVIKDLDVACRKYCAACCTCNVTVTSLEGYRIAGHLTAGGQTDLFAKVQTDLCPQRFVPSVTFNGLAELCARGQDPPEEIGDPAGGACPLLRDDECPLYAVRPFGCRLMVSKQNCRETGYAEMDPWVLSVNNVFLQYIEHIDLYGFSGNLTDILIFMASKKKRRRYSSNNLPNLPANLIANRPIKVLMIPPEHRPKIEPILTALQNIRL